MENIKLDDFLHYRFLSGIEYNKSGELACFAVHQANIEENNYTSVLWIYNQPADRLYQLTGLGSESSFTWLDDGEHVLFASNRRKKDKSSEEKSSNETIFYKINVRGGEAQEAFCVPVKVQRLLEVEADKFLVLGTVNLKDGFDEEDGKDYKILEEIPYWANGGGFTSKKRTHIFSFVPSTGQLDDLTPGTLDIEELTLNEAKTKALFAAVSYEGKKPLTNSLYVLDVTNGTYQAVPNNEPFSYSTAYFTSDTTAIAIGSDMQTFGLNENGKLYQVDLNSGERKVLTPDWDRSFWNSVNSDCRFGGGRGVQYHNGKLYFVSTDGESSYLYRVSGAGQVERLTNAPGSVDGFTVKGEKVLVIALRDQKLQEVYAVSGGAETQVTSFNSWVLEQRHISRPEPLTVETAPGVAIDGWVMRPTNFREGKKYPAILNIHGGPKTVYGTVFVHEMQYWANQGYFVFFCNPRGSDGKGNAFADIRGQYGTIDYDDLMAFTDEVVRRYPAIDESRVGVTGGSYGGYMTNWIIGHTHRFKAAASQRSISNWISMGWTTDIGYFFASDQIAADPWGDHQKLWDHSPLKYADRVKTPTLFIHSDEDYRCWVPEALQMFSALKFHGVESRLCLFHGENHELSRSGKPKNRIKRLAEITQWFDRHLKEN